MLARGRLKSLVFFFLVLLFQVRTHAHALATDMSPVLDASRSEKWLRLYQYDKKAFGGYQSAVTSERFFFSPNGRTDPEAELVAAVKAFESASGEYGTQRQPAACVFPLRKKILESLLARKFPTVDCPDLTNWLERLHSDQASLVFVGAYAGNPASVLGHTFIRLSDSRRAEAGREGLDLLSYSVGFLAQADPTDNRALYMLKGVTGGYPGTYEIEPHYMKVGLYNNSESRDLWDLPLEFSSEEVQLLVLHIWELTFNATFDYYFIDENCSYRLLRLLEAIRPESEITSKLSAVVLPAESVRAVIDAGWVKASPSFRASVKRRLHMKLKLLTGEGRSDFRRARSSVESLELVTDPTVLDALLDHWLYENYKAKANLSREKAAIMEATFRRAAAVQGTSRFQLTSDAIRESEELQAPFQGHRPRWIELRGGSGAPGGRAGLSYRSGVHPFWSSDEGYREVAMIEYLGADVDAIFNRDFQGAKGERARWNLLLVDAKSVEDAFDADHSLSWSFKAQVQSGCTWCEKEKSAAFISGGVGGGVRAPGVTAYVLAHLEGEVWENTDSTNRISAQGALSPGIASGLKLSRGAFTLAGEAARHWYQSQWRDDLDARLTWAWRRDQNFFVRGTLEEKKAGESPKLLFRDEAVQVGFVYFFDGYFADLK